MENRDWRLEIGDWEVGESVGWRMNNSRIAQYASRFTHHASRITHYVSRFTFHVSRIPFHVSRIPFHLRSIRIGEKHYVFAIT
jgi:hypothetical protein